MRPAPRAKRKIARRVTKKSVRAKRKGTRRASSPKKAARSKRTAVRRKAAHAKRSSSRRPAKKAARRASRRPARKPVRARARRPRLHLVRKPARRVPRAARPATPPEAGSAFPQRDGASAKQLLLFELVRARTAFTASVQGMLASSAERPLGAGKWNAREIVLHLVSRDRIRLREMESALRGLEPSWRGITDVEQSTINEQDLAALRHLSWDDALRLLHSTRQELMDSIESVPDQPAEVWSAEHPFGWMMHRLPVHDRHHADAIKTWRTESGV
ncbi:MAG TPA: DinB family protein [Candidatus Udaeobacter sp.]|jgi:hypothetical protein|nr:DinB family protein [Candidatus Udaeobacter sp.]